LGHCVSAHKCFVSHLQCFCEPNKHSRSHIAQDGSLEWHSRTKCCSIFVHALVIIILIGPLVFGERRAKVKKLRTILHATALRHEGHGAPCHFSRLIAPQRPTQHPNMYSGVAHHAKMSTAEIGQNCQSGVCGHHRESNLRRPI